VSGPVGAVGPVYLHPGSQAKALAAALNRLGFTAGVIKTREHRKYPCVAVDSGPARTVKAVCYVYAGPGEDGQWWFWASSVMGDPIALEAVAPLSEVSAAADAVARAVTLARAVFSQAG
jgi:hypothetical protein